MKSLQRDLEKLLRELPEGVGSEPPDNLAERIKSEIPDELDLPAFGPVADPGDPGEPLLAPNVVPGPWLRRRHWLAAASMAAVLVGSFLAYRLYLDAGLRGGPSGERAVAESNAPHRSAETKARGIPDERPDAAPTHEAGPVPKIATERAATSSDTAGGRAGDPGADQDTGRSLGLGVARDTVRGNDSDSTTAPDAEEPAILRALENSAARPSEEQEKQKLDARRRQLEESLRRSRVAGGVAESRANELRALGYVGDAGAEAAPSDTGGAAPAEPRFVESLDAEPAPAVREQRAIPKPVGRADTRRLQESMVITPPSAPGSRLEAKNAPMRQLAPAGDEASKGSFSGGTTGGTAEPNDEPYGDVFFRGYGTNPFIATEDDRLSTFGLDVDTASYSVVRRYLRDGHLPPPEAVRVEEVLNSFDYRDAPPEEGDFALHAEAAPALWGENDRTYLLRFAIQGKTLDAGERASALLTIVVDVSGSMAQENRLGLVKRSLALLIDQLRPDDRLALVVYGNRGRVVLEPTADHAAIRRAIESLRPEGATNAAEGLQLAYELAARHRRPGTINRVILCSDGVANVGDTSAGSILDQIRRHAEQGIELTTLGFGMGNYNDVLMEQLANRGNGRYAYVDTLDEAHRVLVEDLTGTLQTLAAEARSQVEFDPALVDRYRLLGYENRDIADERFRDDTVDAGEIGMGHHVTVLYEVVLKRTPRRREPVATLRLRYASIAAGEMVELERTVRGADFVERWESASPALRLASLVAEWAEALRGSYWARDADLDEVFRRAQKLAPELAGDRDIAELVALMGQSAELRSRRR